MDKTKHNRLVIQQLEARTQPIREIMGRPAPLKGWLQAIRKAIGMTTSQLAGRLTVPTSRISRLERKELDGTATLESMRQTAEAMGCWFVYAVIPETTLEDILRNQAEIVARSDIERVAQTMRLEGRELVSKDLKQSYSNLVDDLVRELPQHLWDR